MNIQTSGKLHSFSMRLIIIAFLFSFQNITAWANDPEIIDLVKTGDAMPTFTFQHEDGNNYSSETLKGKVVVISFFATWCGPCLKELPHIQEEIWNKYQTNPNFNLLVIGREHSTKEVKNFKQKNNYTFPIFADPKRRIFNLFAKQNIPRLYLINKEGEIVNMQVGYNEASFETFCRQLAELLADA